MYFNLRKVKTNDMPAFNAYALICVLQLFNITTLLVLINYFINIKLEKDAAIYTSLIGGIIILIFNRFLLYNKREIIFKKYDNKNPSRKTKGQLFFWLYVLLSLIILFVAISNFSTNI